MELAQVRVSAAKYISRVLSISGHDDVVQLHPDLKKDWDWIANHYEHVGLTHSKNIIWNDNFEESNKYPDYRLSVAYYGESAHKVRPDKKLYIIAKKLNSKNELGLIAQKLGVPTPWFVPFNDKDEIKECKDFQYPLLAKVAVSFGGHGVHYCNNAHELEDSLENKIPPGTPFQLQRAIEGPGTVRITLLYKIHAKGFERFSANEQIIDNYSHVGNIYPASHQPWEVTEPVVEYMYEHGMKGHIGFDLIGRLENLEKGGYKFYLIECNPRYCASTYSTLLARTLGAEHWFAGYFYTEAHRLSDIDLKGLEFNPVNKKGVVLLNWGFIGKKYLYFMIFGLPAEQRQMAEKLKKLL